MTFRIRNDCRLCGSRRLSRVLDLPATPLANEFPDRPLDGRQEEFPLFLSACLNCGHVQLPVVVDPERLFRDYVYVSGTSPVFVDHFRRYAAAMCETLGLWPGNLVVEIGSNDGTLLRFFKDKGMRVLGVDPATDIAARATADGIETMATFFDRTISACIKEDRGRARLVVANNVFAHADDLAEIALGVWHLLESDGRFLFEVSYLPSVIRGQLFDTAYHEHLSYHSLGPLLDFFNRLGMSVVDAELVDTHGGSVRVSVAPRPGLPLSERGSALLEDEREFGLDPYTSDVRPVFAQFANRIAERGQEVVRELRKVKLAGGTIAAYGAPAKATTLLRAFGAEDLIDYVVDDSPHKQGRWMPGGRIPVLPSTAIAERRPDMVLILAWNFADSIIEKLSDYRASGGRVVVPLPDLRVL
jgi:SAM-dependent methyltransferase